MDNLEEVQPLRIREDFRAEFTAVMEASGLTDFEKFAIYANMLGRMSVILTVGGSKVETVRAVADRNFARGAQDAHEVIARANRRAH